MPMLSRPVLTILALSSGVVSTTALVPLPSKQLTGKAIPRQVVAQPPGWRVAATSTGWDATRGVPDLYGPPSPAVAAESTRAAEAHQWMLDSWEEKKANKEVLYSKIFDFDEPSLRSAAMDSWERVDDVIMGGVSSSNLVPDTPEGGMIFQGTVRPEGGGFCGQRMKLLKEPMDLSSFSGIYIKCATPDPDDAARKVWKLSLRTKADRGEVIYSTEYIPAVGEEAKAVLVPFSDFRLVSGPRLVPDGPPVNATAVYQISMTCTKFKIAVNTTELEGFRPGLFRLKIAEIGAFAGRPAGSTEAAEEMDAVRAVLVPPPESAAEARQNRPFVFKLLSPLIKVAFDEKARRRRLAATKLKARGKVTSALALARWGWSRRVTNLGFIGALQVTLANLAQVVAATVLTLPVRLLFKVFGLIRAASKRLKVVGGKVGRWRTGQRPKGFPFRLTRNKAPKKNYEGGEYGL